MRGRVWSFSQTRAVLQTLSNDSNRVEILEEPGTAHEAAHPRC